MEPSDNAGDKITPKSSFFNPTTTLALLIIVVQVLISAGTYPFLPPMVPSHFDASGQVNGYLPKLINAILIPGISIVLFLILRFAVQIGPNLGYQNQRRANAQIINLILVGILLFMLVIQLLTTAYALGAKVDITLVVCLAISVLFMFLGNYLGKLRRNFWAGIRTPWTLTNAVVWERTHRLGGWLFVAVGFAGILCSFIPFVRLWGILVLIIAVSIFLCIYSYICYRQQMQEGHESLSPPFDEEN
ncbi:MAG TPA: SdpI family protein [Ktedonobacteraceae bacterium]|nr:SdpI family protein [Ktedonobacteraceae bacterium]